MAVSGAEALNDYPVIVALGQNLVRGFDISWKMFWHGSYLTKSKLVYSMYFETGNNFC